MYSRSGEAYVHCVMKGENARRRQTESPENRLAVMPTERRTDLDTNRHACKGARSVRMGNLAGE